MSEAKATTTATCTRTGRCSPGRQASRSSHVTTPRSRCWPSEAMVSRPSTPATQPATSAGRAALRDTYAVIVPVLATPVPTWQVTPLNPWLQ